MSRTAAGKNLRCHGRLRFEYKKAAVLAHWVRPSNERSPGKYGSTEGISHNSMKRFNLPRPDADHEIDHDTQEYERTEDVAATMRKEVQIHGRRFNLLGNSSFQS